MSELRRHEPGALRIERPAKHILAFYAGRDGSDVTGPNATWVDEGLRLGVCSYAVIDGEAALVYDTQTSIAHASVVRRTLEAAGVKRITVVLSHWHLDHIAGTEVFADCEILSGQQTDALLALHQAAIESGSESGPPAIKPLIRATRVLSGPTSMTVGALAVELLPADIHSEDSYLVWLPGTRTLLAADAVEDPITYVAEPERLATHLTGLARLQDLAPTQILPSHGDPDVIANGGYSPELIDATQSYVRTLLRAKNDGGLRDVPLRELLKDGNWREVVHYHPAYEQVHRDNLQLLSEHGESA